MKWCKVGARATLQQADEATRFTFRGKPAFVFEYEGVWHAYVNACPHLGLELDWVPGQVFDASKRYLICSTHGAIFELDTGYCVGGPCVGQQLAKLRLKEEDGVLYSGEKQA